MTHRPDEGDSDGAELLTSSEAAALIRVSRRTLHRWEQRGLITPARTPTGQLRYRRREVEALLTVPRSVA